MSSSRAFGVSGAGANVGVYLLDLEPNNLAARLLLGVRARGTRARRGSRSRLGPQRRDLLSFHLTRRAATVASLLLTTEAMVAERPKKKAKGGGDDMDY